MSTVNFLSIKPYPFYHDIVNPSGGNEIININKNSKGGSFTIHFDLKDLYDVNYVVITEEYSKTIYAWIEDWVRERNGMFTVNYKIDAFRTFKDNIKFGLQYVTRLEGLGLDSVKPIGSMKDPMIKTYGRPYENILPIHAAPNDEGSGTAGSANVRYAVIQVRGRSYVGGVDVSSPVKPSNNPLNPSQYRLYVSKYYTNNPNGTSFALNQLLEAMRNMAETSNIVTMYSVPFIVGYEQLQNEALLLRVGDKPEVTIDGFKVIGEYDDIMALQTFKTTIDLSDVYNNSFVPKYGDTSLTRPYPVPSPSFERNGIDFLNGDTAQLITPEGQVLNIPPSVFQYFPDSNDDTHRPFKIEIERIVDLYSGSVSTHIGNNYLSPYSVRSGPLGEITILSDPKESYLAQNKTSRAVGLATTIGGGVLAATTGGVSLAATAAMLGPTASSLVGTAAGIADSGNTYSNQPLFLGETVGAKYNNIFHLVITKHQKGFTGKTYGRPFEEALNFSSQGIFFKGAKGYIQTHQSKVEGGNAPIWAIDEINSLLDSGVFFNKE